MIRTEDLIYRPPDGYKDDFFLYVLNGDALVAGATYQDTAVPINMDADFVLRKVENLRSLIPALGSWNLRYPDGRYLSSLPMFTDNALGSFLINGSASPAIIPEIVYPRGTSIIADLFNVFPEELDPGGEVLP